MSTRAPALDRPSGDGSTTAEVAAAAPAFEVVYERHFDYVWRTLRSFGVPADQIDDAVQDAFVVVHRRLREFEGRAAIETWLFAIARRVAQRYRRTAVRRRDETAALSGEGAQVVAVDGMDRGMPEGMHEALIDGRMSPRDAAERAEATRLLVEILGELGEDQRAVLVLIELEQLTVPAAAEALGINVNTAYSRLRLARQRFEQVLAARVPDRRSDS